MVCHTSIDLNSLVFQRWNISEIEKATSKEEIWALIKAMPPDKAPGWTGSRRASIRSVGPSKNLMS